MKKSRRTLGTIYAWILLSVFIAAHLCKDADVHFTSSAPKTFTSDQKAPQAEVTTLCHICEFTFFQSPTAQPVTFVPMVTVQLIARYIAPSLTVYRQIESVNTHSPPTTVLA